VLFAVAFLVALAFLAARAIARKRRERPRLSEHLVAHCADVDATVARLRTCACGRRLDVDGEGPRRSAAGAERWGVELSCVCGRRHSLRFIVGN
jgi:hypothetical protein